MTTVLFRGHMYRDSRIKRTTILKRNDMIEIVDGYEGEAIYPVYRGTLIPAPVNGHTHIGDSFIQEEPPEDLMSSVGPGGFKHRYLSTVSKSALVHGMKGALSAALKSGTHRIYDFREGGLEGTAAIRKAASGLNIDLKILGRPATREEALRMVNMVSGFGMSAISDHNFDFLLALSEMAYGSGKIFSIHFSERTREDIGMLLQLKPSLIVHGLKMTQEDIAAVQKNGIPLCITPRSNYLYGLNADYSRFYRNGLKVMIGTDNGFATTQDTLSELSFLYFIQRNFSRIDPAVLLKSAVYDPVAGETENSRYLLFDNAYLSEYQIVTKGYAIRKRLLQIT